jgi:hypothetical protein
METFLCLGFLVVGMVENNPNVIEVELTLSQLEYMEGWSRKMSGQGVDTLIRMMIDTMMRTQPQLAKP